MAVQELHKITYVHHVRSDEYPLRKGYTSSLFGSLRRYDKSHTSVHNVVGEVIEVTYFVGATSVGRD